MNRADTLDAISYSRSLNLKFLVKDCDDLQASMRYDINKRWREIGKCDSNRSTCKPFPATIYYDM